MLNEILFKAPGITKNKVGIKSPSPNQASCISSECEQHELSNWLATPSERGKKCKNGLYTY